MSLKAFHIFFIAVSVVLAFGFGVWGVYTHLAESNLGFLVMGLLSFVVGIGLIFYGVNFLHKLRHTR
ncbi:MAG TPA: hypothetical protein VKP65_07785 [Rhodothermales bacterium]|nr:hypothetical protein [Rhodothermales bacterium]